ncbi:MAG: PIN domain-containing protein [Actinobacteria bacterium]|nr:PIN domain-containing protein [Actinomycetota bacterium]MBU4449981.1 PIN domain-containing protein [Actinomycetota bacterium]MCG2789582.1 PIN domain-containing protein [Actinomycetes bacterium]MCG2791292.1 PIN domain-containing protein [Actinomycetes bacterium]
MSKLLLDSNVIINYLLDRVSTVKLIKELVYSGENLSTSVICVSEIQVGVREDEKEKTDLFFDSIEIFDINYEISRIGAFYVSQYKKKGYTLNLLDCLIAATCVLNNIVLVTYNIEHFPIPELKLYDIKNYL